MESEVLESGAGLWQARVPLWVEVWPRGLNAHGGVDRFVAVAGRHFRHFLAQSRLMAGDAKATQTIDELELLVRSLKDKAFMDVLLLP
jgi:hypothetical protein